MSFYIIKCYTGWNFKNNQILNITPGNLFYDGGLPKRDILTNKWKLDSKPIFWRLKKIYANTYMFPDLALSYGLSFSNLSQELYNAHFSNIAKTEIEDLYNKMGGNIKDLDNSLEKAIKNTLTTTDLLYNDFNNLNIKFYYRTLNPDGTISTISIEQAATGLNNIRKYIDTSNIDNINNFKIQSLYIPNYNYDGLKIDVDIAGDPSNPVEPATFNVDITNFSFDNQVPEHQNIIQALLKQGALFNIYRVNVDDGKIENLTKTGYKPSLALTNLQSISTIDKEQDNSMRLTFKNIHAIKTKLNNFANADNTYKSINRDQFMPN